MAATRECRCSALVRRRRGSPPELETDVHFDRYAASAVAAAALIAAIPPADAQTSQDLKALRQDVETLRHDYQAKIDNLETRLAKAEADATAAHKMADEASAEPGFTDVR